MGVEKLKYLIFEFTRYVITGGIAFVVDIAVLYLFNEYIFSGIPFSLYISTAIGFIAGLATNYLLCLKFVFLSVKDTNLGKSYKDRLLFIIIGLVGLVMNEVGMIIGVEVVHLNYLIVKIITAAVVLFWNYIARKHLIFNVIYCKDILIKDIQKES